MQGDADRMALKLLSPCAHLIRLCHGSSPRSLIIIQFTPGAGCMLVQMGHAHAENRLMGSPSPGH
ncbi:hypothetical protein [Paenibacillus peoriae]|uniref:hypothetical protein n=1 Tax=Paenibacillus peoriae TaxID=59893 RepID=UPI0015C37AE3|nr:hypothetical protein [Paenibacillus peoriae]